MNPGNKAVKLNHPDFILRSLQEADLPWRVKWLNDPDILQTLMINEVIEPEKTKNWFHRIKQDQNRLDLFIEDTQGCPVGIIGLRNIDFQSQNACIYIVIGNKEYWGKGLMYSTHLELMKYAYSKLKLHKIWCNVLQHNIASCITLKKIGFQIDGLLRDEFLRDKQFYSVYRFSMLDEEFYRVHGST